MSAGTIVAIINALREDGDKHSVTLDFKDGTENWEMNIKTWKQGDGKMRPVSEDELAQIRSKGGGWI